jgi:hypothetical protein
MIYEGFSLGELCKPVFFPPCYIIIESQWRSGSASVSNARGSGFEPCQGQGFSSSYETPKFPGGGDSRPSDETINRGPVCVHIQNIKHAL